MAIGLAPVQRESDSLVCEYTPNLVDAHQVGQIFKVAPVGVENAHYGDNKILSFVFDFENLRGLLPVHEVGEPIFPLKLRDKYSGDSLWSYLSLTRSEKRQIEYRMANLLNSGCPLPLTVISLTDNVAILSRRRAIDKLADTIDLEVGQDITVTVLLMSATGVWCDYRGINIYIPRNEVFYGYVFPSNVMTAGLSYRATVTKVTGEDNSVIRASTRALIPDPWLNFSCSTGSIRRAKIMHMAKSGRCNLYVAEFVPGIFGVVEGMPLTSYCLGQVVTVRITKFIRGGYLLRGIIIGSQGCDSV